MGHRINLYYPEAPNGGWAIVQHGSPEKPATAYSDFDCTIPTSNRTLTSTGRAGFFVNELVDVAVATAVGQPVDTFTEGVHGDAVTVQSALFTGTDPVTGAQVPDGRILLPDALDRLFTSFGARNGLVRETGQFTDQRLADALANIRRNNTARFNVRDYGAVGDGVTDDSVAVDTARLAMIANGGGDLYFPAGVYLISATIAFPGGLGVGVIISGDSASASFILSTNSIAAISIASGTGVAIKDIEIEVTTISSSPLTITGALIVSCTRVNFDGPGGGENPIIVDGGEVVFSLCRFANGALSTGKVYLIGSSSLVNPCIFIGCETTQTGSPLVTVDLSSGSANIIVTGCTFRSSGYLGSIAVFAAGTDTIIAASGNTLAATSGGPYAFIRVYFGNEAISVSETGNTLHVGAGFTDPLHLAAPGTGNFLSTSRKPAISGASAASGAPRLGVAVTTITATGNFTLNPPIRSDGSAANPWNGAECSVQIYNSTGGNITITLDAAYHGTTAVLATVTSRIYNFRYSTTGTTQGWIQQGPFVDVA